MAMTRPAIVIVDASVAVTGALKAAAQLAEGVSDAARCILVLPESAQAPGDILKPFAAVRRLPLKNPSRRLGALVGYVLGLWRDARALRRMLREENASQLILNDVYLMQGALLRLMGYSGKIFIWVRLDPMRFAGRFAPLLLRVQARVANRLVVVSDFVAGRVAPHARATRIYDFYEPKAVEVPSGAQDTKCFVYLANYIQGKGQDVALKAFATALKSDASLRLAFYGGNMGRVANREYRVRLEAQAQVLGIAHAVTFGEFVSDVADVFRGAFAALNFSDSESFSFTVLEASGAGLPVIATCCGGPEEIVVDGVTGLLIARGDVAAASAAMLSLAQDAPRARGMGEAGAKHVAQNFSREAWRAQIREVLGV
jgi:L-malate glycosyltransferase